MGLTGNETDEELLDILYKKIENSLDEKKDFKKYGRDIILTGNETENEFSAILDKIDEEDEHDQK